MKFLSAIVALLLLSTGCSKNRVDNIDRQSILGKWVLVRITGGLAGLDMSAPQWGHSLSYVFGNAKKCLETYDGTQKNTTYSFSRGFSYTRGFEANFVSIASRGDTKFEFYFAHDTLVLVDDPRVDGTTEWYLKG